MKATRSRSRLILAAALLLVMAGGCIVHDELTTLTINPDGSADLTVYRSNIRSTEQGQKAEAEIASYRDSFDARSQDDFKRIRESGGKLESAVWLRRQAPLANLAHASFPNPASLEKLALFQDDDGHVFVKPKFTVSPTSSTRRFSFQITLKPDQIPTENPSPTDVKQIKLERASRVSDTRIALASGKFTKASGFIIADDKQSALLDPDAIYSLVQAGKGNAECFLEWESPKE